MTLPSCAATMPRVIAKPSPAPAPRPGWWVRDGSPRKPTSNTRARSSGAIPPHSSETVTSAVGAVGSSVARSTICTVPCWQVCRMALTSRLVSARFSSAPLPTTSAVEVARPTRRTPCRPATGSSAATQSETRSSRLTRSVRLLGAPACSREISNRSSTMPVSRSTSIRICL